MEDPDLMAAIAQGDERALTELLKRHRKAMVYVAVSIIHNPDDAEDVVQDVCMELWSKAGAYEPAKGRVLNWLCTVTRNRAIDRYRQIERYSARMERHAQSSDPYAVQMPEEPETLLARIEATVAFTPLQAQCFELTIVQGMSKREAALYLGVPLGTMGQRMEETRKVLRRSMQPHAEEPAPKRKGGRPPKPVTVPVPREPSKMGRPRKPGGNAYAVLTKAGWCGRIRWSGGKQQHVGVHASKEAARQAAVDVLAALNQTPLQHGNNPSA